MRGETMYLFLMIFLLLVLISASTANRSLYARDEIIVIDAPRRRRRRDWSNKNSEDFDDEGEDAGTERSERRRESGRSKKGKKKNKRKKREHKEEHSIGNIWVGDIVSIAHLDKDFLVEEHHVASENSWEWDEYTLSDGDDEYNLTVEEGGKVIVLSHEIEDLGLSHPPPKKIEYEGESYKLAESGKAEHQPNDGERGEGAHPYRYYTYEGPKGFSILMEDWEGEVEYHLGEQLHQRDVHILPGPSQDQG